MRRRTPLAALCLFFALLLCCAGKVRAQKLEPRAYSLSPAGTNFLGMAYLYSTGNAVLDPSLPVRNVNARVHTFAPYYGRTFGLFGKLANASITTPFADTFVSGEVEEESRSVDRTGLGDVVARLAVNLIGGPALTPQEFFKFKQGTTLGASITVSVPLGQYDPAKLINLGTNRWAFKSELGLSYPHGPWDFEFYAGAWLFTANTNFFGGQVRRQAPLASLQAHVVYTIRTHMWVSLDLTYYAGGSTTVDGQKKIDRKSNTRGGLTLSFPVTQSQSLKLNWSKEVTTRSGTAFKTFGVAWQVSWF